MRALRRAAGALLRQTGRFIGQRVRSHGVELDLSSPLVADETRAALFWGFYEGSERRAALRFLRPGLPVIELGASLGFLTALIARRIAPVAQVAVEANPALTSLLRRTLELNHA